MSTINEAAQEISNIIRTRADQEVSAVLSTQADLSRNLTILSVVALVVCSIAALSIIRSISTGMKTSIDMARSVAQGDLSVKVTPKGNNEISDLLSAQIDMVDRLRDTLTNVDAAARNLSVGSEQMAGTSETLSEGAAVQASSTEEVSAAVEQMSANISASSENSSETETDRPPGISRSAEIGGCGFRSGLCHADDRRADQRSAGHLAPDRSFGPERCGGGGAGR